MSSYAAALTRAVEAAASASSAAGALLPAAALWAQAVRAPIAAVALAPGSGAFIPAAAGLSSSSGRDADQVPSAVVGGIGAAALAGGLLLVAALLKLQACRQAGSQAGSRQRLGAGGGGLLGRASGGGLKALPAASSMRFHPNPLLRRTPSHVRALVATMPHAPPPLKEGDW